MHFCIRLWDCNWQITIISVKHIIKIIVILDKNIVKFFMSYVVRLLESWDPGTSKNWVFFYKSFLFRHTINLMHWTQLFTKYLIPCKRNIMHSNRPIVFFFKISILSILSPFLIYQSTFLNDNIHTLRQRHNKLKAKNQFFYAHYKKTLKNEVVSEERLCCICLSFSILSILM